MTQITLKLDWKPLSEVAQQASSDSGIYFLGAPFRIAYDQTESRVFYIGSSSNLRKRLVSHLRSTERGNYLLLRFASATKDNIACCAFPFPAFRNDKLFGLEGEAIYAFGLKHGFIPHGNRSPEGGDSFGDKIDIAETNSTALELLNETDIAARYDMRVDRDPYPMYSSLSATIELVGGDVKIVETKEAPKIYSVNFVMAATPKASKKIGPR